MTEVELRDRLKFTKEQIDHYAQEGLELTPMSYNLIRRVCQLFIEDYDRVYLDESQRSGLA